MKIVERHRYRQSEIFETRELIFEPFDLNNIDTVVELIRNNLTPDLLKGKRLMFKGDTSKYYGHCYHASHSLFLMMNTDELVPMSAEDYRGEKHWWLQKGELIYDCTSEQYYEKGQTPPYDKGKKSQWYGWKQRPQQITMNLIKRVAIQQGVLLGDNVKVRG